MFNPLAKRNRITRPATAVGCTAVVLVAVLALVATVNLSEGRQDAARAAESATLLVNLGEMTATISAAQKELLLAEGTDLAGEIAAATVGIQAVESSRQRWEVVRSQPHLDPELVARIDAWYALDRTSGIDEVFKSPGDIAPAVNRFGQDMEQVRPLLSALVRTELASQQERLEAVDRSSSRTRTVALSSLVATLVFLAAVTWRAALVERRRIRDDERRTRRGELEATVKRAMAMVDREDSVVEVLLRASSERTGGAVVAMMADSSRAHFHRLGEDVGTCDVDSPANCPAARQGHTLMFPSSEALDACPHLGRADGVPCGAVCVPMAVEGQTIGVLHHGREAGEVPVELAADLSLVASETSQRTGMLRALRTSRTQASTDVLTGLPNRRHIEERVRALRAAGIHPSVVYADLDHFKRLNDRFGHETGDRALALFARVCAESVRSSDVVARFGGEEFVIVLPDGGQEEAAAVLERIRSRLVLATAQAGIPSFTASFGLAVPLPDEPFDAVLRRADAALMRAKEAGRNRVVVAEDDEVAAHLASERPAMDEPGGAPGEPAESPVDLRSPLRL